jgi:hypothetical protein
MDQQASAIRARWIIDSQSLRTELRSPRAAEAQRSAHERESSPSDATSVRISDARAHGPRSSNTRSSSIGARDTPVDPLQLVWTIGRERDDFVNF